MKPLAYFRPGDGGKVELVTVVDETINGEPTPVIRAIPLDPDRAIQLGYSAIGEGLTAKRMREVSATRGGD